MFMAMNDSAPSLAFYTHGLTNSEDFGNALRASGARVAAVAPNDLSRRGACDAFAAAGIDHLDAAVVAVAPADRGPARPLLDWSAQDWRRCADETQLSLLTVLQGLRDAFAGRRCAVVLVGGSLGMTGAASHVALATATEGQRGLMKSLARQWAPDIRFAWLSVWTPLLFPDIAAADLPEQCELGDYAPPLGRPGWREVAEAAVMLCRDGLGNTTGQTMIVDGGEWMLS